MIDIDELGKQVSNKLKAAFPKTQNLMSLPYTWKCASGVLIGLEIEVPWRSYFPNLWETYFQGGTRKYSEMTEAEKVALTDACTKCEEKLLPQLQQTISCGIPRGKDRYWEFALPPVHDLSITYNTLRLLHGAELLPWGPHSLQATVSGLKNLECAYIFLFLLEVLFVRKERIAQPLNGQSTWARRGTGGVYQKGGGSLLYAQRAFEFRTLELSETVDAFESFLSTFATLSHLFTPYTDPQTSAALHCLMTKIFTQFRLPYAMWGSPWDNISTWKQYMTCFEEIRVCLREHLYQELGIVI